MHLYNVTLQRPGTCQTAINGNFSAPKVQEIIVSKGTAIELLRPDQHGKLKSIAFRECFGIIRSMSAFRLAGANRDHVVVGSDSGRIVVLRFDNEKNQFEQVHKETFGKSGVRRVVPGQFCCVDPKGRAVMLAAVEKQKVVYVLNRDSQANLTISSPLEANKGKTIAFDVCAVDNGLENPGFMAIELFYGEADVDDTGEAAAEAQKMLTYYELDLGLNHVARKWSEPVDNGANKLIPVPGGSDGPGGVIVCCENFLVYRAEKHEEIRCVIPRRTSLDAERGVLIASFASHRSKNGFFFIAQSEYGDCYKVTLDWTNRKVSELKMKYFDTVPVCSALCVLKTGFLFCGSEFGAHALFQFIALGDDEESAESSSKTLKKIDNSTKKKGKGKNDDGDDEEEENFQPVFFNPRKLKNLALIDEIESLSPTIALASNISRKEETPRLLALCGQGPRSTFRVLRQGVPLSEMARSPLPGNPNGVFTIRKSKSDTTDAYIVVSFTNATLVLSIGDTVEEVTDTGILATSSTLAVSALGDDDDGSLIQIHPSGVRHVRGNNKGVNEWRAPGRKKITACACNRGQAIVALTGGELVYFELDEAGQLLEIEKIETSSEVVSVDIPPIPDGSLRAKFAAVAGYDSTVRVLSLNPGEALRSVGVQATPSPPESVLLLEVNNKSAKNNKKAGSSAPPSMFLNVGLSNGVLVRCEVDRVSGALSDARSRFVGQRPPKLNRIEMNEEAGFVALSTRPWLGFNENGRFSIVPACHETIDRACGFASEQVLEGIVAVVDGSLRILACENLGEAFSQSSEKARYTPRAMSTHPDDPDVVAVIETDRGIIGFEDRTGEETRNEYVVEAPPAKKTKKNEEEDEEEDEEDDAYQLAPIEQFGAPKSTANDNNNWSSCIRIVDAANAETLCVQEIKNNERVVSVAHAYFSKADEVLLVVGSAKNFVLQPRDCDGGMIRCYRYKRGGGKSSNGETANGKSAGNSKAITGLELVHETPCEGAPFALRNFEGKLLVGVDDVLRLYDFGKKKLLRKAECAQKFPSFINDIRCSGDRFYVTDACESAFFVKYVREDDQECSMHIFADDVAPRYVTSMLPLDRDTVAVSDKFGNFAALRLPKDVSDEIESDISGGKHAVLTSSAALGALNGANNKLQACAQFHVGDVICSLTKCALQTGGSEVIVYATLGGALGAFVPFASKDEADFCTHLEMHLRIEAPPILGNEHGAFRSSYFPVKAVVDGDLCEQFGRLGADAQRRISEEMDRTPSEIVKRLEQIRARAG